MIALLTLFATAPASAQGLDLPALSPRAEVMQTVGVVQLRVTYSSPAKRGRPVWGELVPYGELWRTGANSATTLQTSGPISVGGTEVPAGTYALFTIPGEATWTVILNRNAEQGGTGSYDEALDVARVEVPSAQGGGRENLTFVFTDTTETSTRLDLVWDGVRVEVPITVDTGALVAQTVTAYQSSAAGQLTQAARYYSRNKNFDRALALVNASIDLEESWFNVWTKAEILDGSGERRQAWRIARKALELGKASEDFFWKDRVEKAVSEWRRG